MINALTNNPIGSVRPVFLDQNRQKSYDQSEPSSFFGQASTAPSLQDVTYGSAKTEKLISDSFLFSPAIKAAKAGTLKLPGKNFLPQVGATNAPTPQSYKNLNTNFNKIGAITTGYGDSTRYEKFHPAIDIANKIGTPVPSFVPGKVTEVVTGKKHGDKGYGNYVIVTDANGDKHRYSHLSQSFVRVGDSIGKGQQIGAIGDTGSTYSNSGKSTGAHLDYRIVDAYGKAVNPYNYLKQS